MSSRAPVVPTARPAGAGRGRRRAAARAGAALLLIAVVAGCAGAHRGGSRPSPAYSVTLVASGYPAYPPLVRITPAPAGGAPGDTRDALSAYLSAIVRADWASARLSLCAPLRSLWSTPAEFGRRIAAEAHPPVSNFVVESAGTDGLATYRLSGGAGSQTWGGGPYQARLVGEAGHWKVCGATVVSGVFADYGFALKP